MKYRTIVADPPWPYEEGFATRSRTAGKWTGPTHRYGLSYPSMPVEAISALPIAELADGDSRLFLWATNRYLPIALEIMKGWAFRYRQTLTWDKSDSLSGSVAPNSEFILVGVRGTPGLLRRMPSAVIRHSATKSHSQKPDVFLDWVEQISPGPYVELFARRHRLGWDVWGNESANTATLEVAAD